MRQKMNRSCKLKNRRAVRGYSIIELLVAIGIFSFLLLGAAGTFWQFSSSVGDQDLFTSRARIFQSLVYMMGMPATIRASVESEGAGGALWNCVKLSGACDAKTLHDVTLVLPEITTDAANNVITSTAISGPPAHPLRYSYQGEICDPVKATCPEDEYPISVSTRFEAICPPAYDINSNGIWPINKPIYPDGLQLLNKCNNSAHYIKIHYVFSPTPGASTKFDFAPISGVIYVSSVAVRTSY